MVFASFGFLASLVSGGQISALKCPTFHTRAVVKHLRKLKKLTNRYLILFFLLSIGLNSCDNLTQKEFFDKIVYDEYHSNYEGIVTDKYIDKQNHARPIIIIQHQIFGDTKKDFVFQSSELFDFIKIGDTITKKNGSLKFNLKRKNLDTIIKLDFDNVKKRKNIILKINT